MRTSKVLVVWPMYEELQPGQVNSHTTFDWLNGGVVSFVLFCDFLFYSDVNIRVDETSPKLTFKLLNKLLNKLFC